LEFSAAAGGEKSGGGACGRLSVILKPRQPDPLCVSTFAECVDAVGLPMGVFQMVAGSAAEIGQEFLENPLCRKITFTGSTRSEKKLIEGAARQVKPLSLELGGHAPVLVFDDADLSAAIEGTLLAKFRNKANPVMPPIGFMCSAAYTSRF